jgi:hypothetical protein
VGDRFAHQAKAQLRACQMAAEAGANVVPVWNKSNREHLIVGSEPSSVRAAADAAVHELGWTRRYHVDADHINLSTVDRFVHASDFYTLDVAAAIGGRLPRTSMLSGAASRAESCGREASRGRGRTCSRSGGRAHLPAHPSRRDPTPTEVDGRDGRAATSPQLP